MACHPRCGGPVGRPVPVGRPCGAVPVGVVGRPCGVVSRLHLAPSGERCSYWLADAPDGTVGHRGLSRGCHGSVRSGPTADRPLRGTDSHRARHRWPPTALIGRPDGPSCRPTARWALARLEMAGRSCRSDPEPSAHSQVPGALLDRLDETAISVEALTGMSAPPRIVAAIRSASEVVTRSAPVRQAEPLTGPSQPDGAAPTRR